MGDMTPTQTLAKLLEESGAQIVMPNATVREAFAALEAENVRLREHLDTYEGAQAQRGLSTYAFNEYGRDARLYNGIIDLEAEVTRLTAERADLQADRERLDWLNNQLFTVKGTDYPEWRVTSDFEDVDDVRQAIDAARKAGA